MTDEEKEAAERAADPHYPEYSSVLITNDVGAFAPPPPGVSPG